MVLSDTTNKTGLIQDAETLLGFDDAAISGNTTLLKRFVSLFNIAQRKIEIRILQVCNPNWKWDDPNYSDLPTATQDLVASQNDYVLPTATGTYNAANATTLLSLEKLAILDSAGNQKTLRPSNLSEVELNLLYATDGQPEVYILQGSSVKLYPAPDSSQVTLTAGLIAEFSRIGKDFASTGTDSQTPGFAAPFHRLVSLQACMDYASSRKGLQNLVPYLLGQYNELMTLCEEFYANRLHDRSGPGARRLVRRQSNHF